MLSICGILARHIRLKFEYHEALGQSKILMKGHTLGHSGLSASAGLVLSNGSDTGVLFSVQGQQQAAAQLRRQSESEQHAATSAAAIFQEGSRQARQHSEQAMQWVRCSV